MGGPLSGLRVVEFAGLGPVPFCGMHLAQLGAEVVLVQRPGAAFELGHAALHRGKTLVELDLKTNAQAALTLVSEADVLVEGFRPGVMERLGLGPDVVMKHVPSIVYGRMTGWGQTGPRAEDAGHDVNYLGLTGALAAIGPKEAPAIPLNLIGDFGGGALYLLVGVLAALHRARQTGQGDVVDAAIVDGVAHLSSMIWALRGEGSWSDGRQSNLLDGAAPFYGAYACADGAWLAVGPIEPAFFDHFWAGLDLPLLELSRMDRAKWPVIQARIAGRLAERERAAWLDVFDGTDACVTPIHDFEAALRDPHLVARRVFEGSPPMPRAAPRFGSGAESAHKAGGPQELGAVLARWRGIGSTG